MDEAAFELRMFLSNLRYLLSEARFDSTELHTQRVCALNKLSGFMLGSDMVLMGKYSAEHQICQDLDELKESA